MRMLIAAGAVALGVAALPLTSAHAVSTWVVDIHATRPNAVIGGRVVTIRGKVHPRGAAAGEKVVLQEKFKPGARWVTQSEGRISPTGRYGFVDIPTKNTLHAYRVVAPATRTHRRGVSSAAKVIIYGWEDLSGLAAVRSDFMTTGTVDINGTRFFRSVYASAGTTQSAEYNLDDRCISFRATFGISDASSADGQAQVDAFSDGTNVYSRVFGFGQSEQRTVALATPLKLRLEAHSTGDVTTQGFGAFGTAQVLCTR